MISVIIPTYNVEDYISVCLNSILKQTYDNFEIICIDDYSTDSTLEILEYFQKKDQRIKILKNNENKGPGYSRNQGLNIAKGKYIFFLDSDDWISPNAFELLYSKSEELDLDLLIYKTIVYYDNESNFGNEKMYDMDNMIEYTDNIFNPSQYSDVFYLNIASAPWIKFYNKSFLDKNNIRFPNENLIQEDEAFFLNVLFNATRVSFLDKYLHNRRKRDNSIMTLKGERLLDNIQIADIMINICLKNKSSYEIHKKGVLNYIFKTILNGKYESIDEEFKPILFVSIKELYKKCYEEYNLKEDILENVDNDILIKFEQIEEDSNSSENKKYLTIDVGGTNIKYSLINRNIEILEKGVLNSNLEENALFDSLDEIILLYLNQIDGIALSCPGIIDINDGILCTGGSFGWISNLPLKSILEEKYDIKVWIENDGKCAALAELWKGNLSDCKNGAIIGLGTGIAGGIIINGELYRGINDSAAEFSSMINDYNNPFISKKFSDIGGRKGLINLYAKSKELTTFNSHKFFEDYQNGDEKTIKILKDYAKIIATGIINIQSILDIEKFCIGGGISAQDVLIDEIRDIIHNYFENKASSAIKEPIIDKCYFENDAGCVGALYNFLKMENQL